MKRKIKNGKSAMKQSFLENSALTKQELCQYQ